MFLLVQKPKLLNLILVQPGNTNSTRHLTVDILNSATTEEV